MPLELQRKFVRVDIIYAIFEVKNFLYGEEEKRDSEKN